MSELGMPPAAQRDPQSWELMRVWIAEHRLHCSLKIGVYDSNGMNEEKAWGIALADAARHVSDAMSAMIGRDRNEALQAIRLHFEQELAVPTSDTKGSFCD